LTECGQQNDQTLFTSLKPLKLSLVWSFKRFDLRYSV